MATTKTTKTKKPNPNKEVIDKLKEEVLIPEAYITAIFWNDPAQYDFIPKEKLDTTSFLNENWGFWFGLGRYMYAEKGVRKFDDISIMKHVKDLGLEKHFDKYGGFESVREVQEEVEGFEENLDGYYKEVKKYGMMVNLVEWFGARVAECNDKYDYKKMNKEQLHTYWLDKINKLAMDGDARYEEHFLLEGIRESVDLWDENPNIGLPFYRSKMWTNICTGWDLGCLYIYGGFGGSGKTSLIFNKVIMSCIDEGEKLLILANEQGIEDFKKLLIATVMGIKKTFLKRQRMNEGEFTEEEREKIASAIEWLEQLENFDSKVVAFVFMEDYIISDVKKIIRHYANRGYKSVLIDTGKPSEGDGAFSMARWERFTEDFKELYKMCRPNGGGLNLRMWVNVQLADTALTRRFLNEHAFGDSKKIKNEASVVFMGRALWDDEYEGGDHEIEAWNYVKTDPDNPKHDQSKEYNQEFFKLPRFTKHKGKTYENIYYVIFTPKNRRGKDNKMGQDILVLRADLNNNSWHEVGYCKIFDDRAY
jgi:replicative DNA helicase